MCDCFLSFFFSNDQYYNINRGCYALKVFLSSHVFVEYIYNVFKLLFQYIHNVIDMYFLKITLNYYGLQFQLLLNDYNYYTLLKGQR